MKVKWRAMPEKLSDRKVSLMWREGRGVLWINPLLHCEYVLLSLANKKLIGTGNIHLQERTVQ